MRGRFGTRLSRVELLLAVVTGVLLGQTVASLAQLLPLGNSDSQGARLAVAASVALLFLTALIGYLWRLARTTSTDLAIGFVALPDELRGRPEFMEHLRQRSRDWVPIEMRMPEPCERREWTTQTGHLLATMLETGLARSVGTPRVLISPLSKDALAFLLGSLIRPQLSGAHVLIDAPPTLSKPDDKASHYRSLIEVNPDVLAAIFQTADGQSSCRCPQPMGAAVVDPARSPGHDADRVIADMVNSGVVCCRDSVILVDGAGELSASAVALRSRLRALSLAGSPPDLFLTCGAPLALALGLTVGEGLAPYPWIYDRTWVPWLVDGSVTAPPDVGAPVSRQSDRDEARQGIYCMIDGDRVGDLMDAMVAGGCSAAELRETSERVDRGRQSVAEWLEGQGATVWLTTADTILASSLEPVDWDAMPSDGPIVWSVGTGPTLREAHAALAVAKAQGRRRRVQVEHFDSWPTTNTPSISRWG